MKIKFLASALLLLGAACTQNTFGNGTTSDGQLLTADMKLSPSQLYVESYVVEFPGQKKCSIAPSPKQLRAGQTSFPMTCTNGETGKAHLKHSVHAAGDVTTILSFALNSGVTGIVNFAGGWEV